MTEAPQQIDPVFDAALEECCRRVANGEPLEACLADYAFEFRDELIRLVPVIRKIVAVRHDPSQQFQDRFQRTFLDAVDVARNNDVQPRRADIATQTLAGNQSSRPVPSQDGRFRRRLTPHVVRLLALAAACLIVLTGGGVAVVFASESSLPDSPLYQVKEAQESAELWLARDEQSRLNLYARQTRRRAVELAAAVDSRKPQAVVGALAARLATSTDGMVNVAISMGSKGNSRPSVRTRALIAEIRLHLGQITPNAAPPAQTPLMRLDAHLDQQAQRLPPRVPGTPRRGATR